MHVSLLNTRQVLTKLQARLNERDQTIKTSYTFNGNVIQKLIDDIRQIERNKGPTADINTIILKLRKSKWPGGMPKYNSQSIDTFKKILKEIYDMNFETENDLQLFTSTMFNKYIKPFCSAYKHIIPKRSTNPRATTSRNANDIQHNWPQHDIILFLLMFVIERDGYIDSNSIKSFTKKDIKQKWDLLNYTRNNHINFDNLWNKFRNKSIIRISGESSKNSYQTNAPQQAAKARKWLKDKSILKKLLIDDTIKITKFSTNIVYHILASNIKEQLLSMGFSNEIFLSAIENVGHHTQEAINYAINNENTKQAKRYSISNELHILSLISDEEEEYKARSDEEGHKTRVKKRKKKKKRRRIKIRDAKPLFSESDQEIADANEENNNVNKMGKFEEINLNIINCPICTFHNDINAVQCEMCETKLKQKQNMNLIKNKQNKMVTNMDNMEKVNTGIIENVKKRQTLSDDVTEDS
eukprot:103454_1